MCDCDRALELLSLELDGALTPEEGRALTAHLNGCGACRRTAEELRQLHTILPELEEEVPAGLHQAIMDRVRAEKVIPFSGGRRKGHIRQWASLAAVFAVILLGAGTLKELQSGGPIAAAPAAASTIAADNVVGERAVGDTGQPETAGEVQESADFDNEAMPAESAPVLAQNGVEEDSGGAALRLGPPASAQPTPVPAQTEEDGGSSQEKAEQAGTFSIMPAGVAADSETVQPDADAAEILRANCAAWLAESAFDQKERVDTGLMTVRPVTEGDLAAAVCDDGGADLPDAADWAVTLGDPTGHDFAILLCDSETLEVLGYVPIA